MQEALLRAARGPSGPPVVGEVRWVRPENVHLTLRFLGDVPVAETPRVAEALRPVGGRHETFEVATAGFGAFPSANRVRVLWAGVGAGSDGLRSLAGDASSALEPLGFGRESRPYVPHLTLCRARGRPAQLGAAGAAAGTASVSLRFRVTDLALAESVSGEGGVFYPCVERYALREA